jgi:quercetin dioxygenase-like cupin family protein
MRVSRGRQPGKPSELRASTFTGRVWADPVLGAQDEVTVNDVFFEPGARTHWHRHGVAQVLFVTHGEGLVVSRDGTGARIGPGDVVHIPAGEEHWHGATPSSYLIHAAVSVGPTEWLEPVADDDYVGAAERRAQEAAV